MEIRGTGLRRARTIGAASLVLVTLALGAMSTCRVADITDAGRRPRYAMVPGDGLPPREPNRWFHAERTFPLGAIPRDRWRAAQGQAAALRRVARSGAPVWERRGPRNIGGRMTDVAVHPVDDDVAYAAAAEGGVWRTTDAGQTWTPLFDDQPTAAVGAVAIDPAAPDVIYAGTGEVNPGGGSVAYGGAGLFRSTDAGTTWSCIGLEDSGSIGRVVIDPTDSDRIFVAVMGHLWDAGPARGVYRTTDGGATWERVHFINDETGCVDLVIRPDDPDVVFAAMWQRLRQPEFFDYGGPGCSVYRTGDGGDTWTLVGGGLPAPNGDDGRIGLSLCASEPDVMHAIYATRVGFFDGIYRSTDGGAAWERTNDADLAGMYSSFGWWFGNIRTHPHDPDTIFALGLPFYRSTDGGASYQFASGGMHVDHHALAFGPGTNPVMYEGNDGGMYRSTNGGTNWSKLNDLPVTQAYRIAIDPNNPDAVYAGTQDNGTVRTQSGNPDGFTMILGGDGFQPLVHPNDSSRLWAQTQYGSVNYSSNGGNSWSRATSGISSGDRDNWNAPHAQDPTDADRRYFGTNRVYRSTGNTSWTVISPDLTDGPHQGRRGQVNGTLTTIGVSPRDGSVIWAGSDDGRVHVTTNGGTTWTDVSASLPVRWITSVRGDPFERATAYVTISGFRWAETMPRVFRTTDFGATWTAIHGNLPDAPVNEILPDPSRAGRYFVATDLGAYETINGGATWSVLGDGLPNVVVTSLARSADGVLTAGTFGRSVFSIDVATITCPWDLDDDGAVNLADLLLLLAAWGPNPGHPADFNGDDVVGIFDLIELLSAWGLCP